MPVCDRCGKGYEASERVCPSCGMPPDSTPPRCGPVAMLAMRIAWVAAFIAVIVCVLGGAVAVIRGAWFGGDYSSLFWRQWVTANTWPLAWRFVTQRARTK